jgi:quinoprotein glucose dehydrogenase
VRTLVLAGIVAISATYIALARQPSSSDASRYRGWAAYGGGPEQLRYSSLSHITPENVRRLEVAWTYDSGGSGDLQAQPVIVDDVLYAYSPAHKAFAIDAVTGKPLWTFDPKIVGRGPNRGVMYWADGTDRRVFAAVDQYLYALDARTGVPIPTFGTAGRIDLRENLGRPAAQQSVRLTTPGVVYRDLVIIGGRVSEGLPASPGDVRAYDARTGRLRWSFHTIPHPGEFGYETWSKASWRINGGANSWAGMALDVRRGLVYVPTGSASADFYGANRIGDNLFANSLIALDAATGERRWHFQIVRHDIWDRDLPSPPTLLTIRRNGQPIDAVVQNTKHGFVFVFDRETGRPVFPLESRAYPASDVPGEAAAPTQLLPVVPKPIARQHLTVDLLTARTPEANAWARQQFGSFRSGGQFVPLTTLASTVIFPGFDGGPEWGGAAADPETGFYYVNANDLAWTGGLAATPPAQVTGASSDLPYRFTGYRRFMDPDGYPATAPPWGTLTAIDLNTGEHAWQVPLGEYPELAAKGLTNTGTENYGGPIVTAGGLVFIAATNFDRKFRAFDKRTGALLWETTLPFAGNATPATYEAGGRQFVVIFAGGGKSRTPAGAMYVAFALPQGN